MLTSSVPYLLRAVNEWILDNNCTPFLVVDATVEGTIVPMDYVKDGQIILNIGPQAIRDLVMVNEHVMFNGRFNGIAHEIYVPMDAVLGLVTRENGEGMWFPREETPPEPPGDGPGQDGPGGPTQREAPKKKGKPSLKVIK